MKTDEKNEIYAIDFGGGKSSCDILQDLSPTLSTTHYGEPVVAYIDGWGGNMEKLFIDDKMNTIRSAQPQVIIKIE